VTLKKEASGAWCASFCIEVEDPEDPPVESLSVDDCVGIDLGVLNYIHNPTGLVVDQLDLFEDRGRLEREQRALSRKEYESNNWDKHRQRIAKVHARMNQKKWDFKNKLAYYYTTHYKAVFLEDLNVKGMLESPQSARNKAEVGSGGETSFLLCNTTGRRTGVTWSRSNQRIQHLIARCVERVCTNRCGFENTRVRRAGLKRTEITTRL
jgi:Transposase and inactivated derivatives